MVIRSGYQAQRRDVSRQEEFRETTAGGRLERTRVVGVVRQIEGHRIRCCARRHRESPGYELLVTMPIPACVRFFDTGVGNPYSCRGEERIVYVRRIGLVKRGRNFVKGRLSSHVYATEPVVALMGFGYRGGEGGRAEKNVILKVWISFV